jgi:hypothetical protein
MKIKLTIIVVTSIFCISCNRQKYSGEFPLEQFSKELLPEAEEIHFINSLGDTNILLLDTEDNYFENEVWETEPNLFRGITEFRGDFENLKKSYHSNSFRISYHLYVNGSNAGQWNYLITNIESDLSDQRINFSVSTEENYSGLPSLVFQDSIEFDDTTIYDIYAAEHQGQSYYFQLGKGIIRFEYDGELWTLSD